MRILFPIIALRQHNKRLCSGLLAFFLCIGLAHQAVSASASSPYQPYIQRIQKRLKKRPNDPRLHTILGRLYQKSRERSLAERAYRRALHLKPKYLHAELGLAKLHLDRRQWAPAQVILLRLRRRRPKHAPVHVALSDLYRLRSRRATRKAQRLRLFRLSLKHADQAIQLQPKNPSFQYRAGILRLAYRKPVKAHLHFATATSLRPYHPCYRLGLHISQSFILADKAKQQKALRVWIPRCQHPLLQRMGVRTSTGLAIQIAQHAQSINQPKRALKILRRALRRDPSNRSGQLFLLMLLYQQNRCTEARQVLQKLRRAPQHRTMAEGFLKNPKFRSCFQRTGGAKARVKILRIRQVRTRPTPIPSALGQRQGAQPSGGRP